MQERRNTWNCRDFPPARLTESEGFVGRAHTWGALTDLWRPSRVVQGTGRCLGLWRGLSEAAHIHVCWMLRTER